MMQLGLLPGLCEQSLEATLDSALLRYAKMGMQKSPAATHDWTPTSLQTILLQDPAVAAHPEAVIRPNNAFFRLTMHLVRERFAVQQVRAGSNFRQTNKALRRCHLDIRGPDNWVWTDLEVHLPPS